MEIRSYSKSELAQAYAPDITPRSAVQRLVSWLEFNEELMDALLATGYKKKQRILTVKQVKLIFDYLGNP